MVGIAFYIAGALYASTATLAVPTALEERAQSCKYLPSDPEWPSADKWNQLNKTVNGRLIGGKPLAEVCHGAKYNDALCQNVKSKWIDVPYHIADPVSVQAPFWQNNSCTPYAPRDASCTLGNLASYAINVTTPEHIVAGLKFARDNNIRLSIKNTGHDYIGRSAGRGSLSLWTHNMKNLTFFDYKSSYYNGPAARIGAGNMAYEVYPAAEAQGLRIVGGFCPTVGIAGGYVQGGGHGPLLSTYGMAADQTLEFDVITADGKRLTASPTQNSDLYFALNGGGGGTYAVVLSHTTKAYKDGAVGGASFSFNNTNDDVYWGAVASWQKNVLEFDKVNNVQSVYSFSNKVFSLYMMTWPGASAADVAALLKPFTDDLTKRNIKYTLKTTKSDTFYKHYSTYTPNLPYGNWKTNDVMGGRLISREAVINRNQDLVNAYRDITKGGKFSIVYIASNVTKARVGTTPGENSVLPAWRDSLAWLYIHTAWDPASPVEELYADNSEANAHEAKLTALTPGGGSYMNEARYNNPNWKEVFYGVNYDKLLSIKKKYDPTVTFYGPTVVGNDYWNVANDGRLCKA